MRNRKKSIIMYAFLVFIIVSSFSLALTQPSIIYPNSTGIIVDTNITINWTVSADSDNIIKYHLFYSNDSGVNWNLISNNVGYIDSFNDTDNVKNISFSGNENYSFYISVPKIANINDAKLNITGHQNISGPYTQLYNSFSDESQSDGSEDGSADQISFGRISAYYPIETYLLIDTPPDGEITMLELLMGPASNSPASKNIVYNINIAEAGGFLSGQNDNTSAYTRVKSNFAMSEEWGTINNVYKNMTFDTPYTMNSSKKYVIWFEFVSSTPGQNGAYSVSYDENPSSNYTASFYNGAAYGFSRITDVRLYNSTVADPSNVWLEVGDVDGVREFNHTGDLNSINQTSNFSSNLQSYVDANCTVNLWENCSVPVLFHSDSAGILEIAEINIKYTNYWWNTTSLSELTTYRVNVTPANDSSNGTSGSSSNDFTISHETPNVTLNLPSTNYSNSSSDPVNVEFNCSATDDFSLNNLSLYITTNQNTSFALNQTVNSTGIINSTIWTLSLTNGNYSWNCLAYDKVGNSDWGDLNRSITIDYSAPSTSSVVAADSVGGSGGRGMEIDLLDECNFDYDCEYGEFCHKHECINWFDIKIIEFESPVSSLDFFDFTYYIKSVGKISGDVEISFWIERDNEIVTSGFDTIYLGDYEEKTESANIFLPKGLSEGLYDFYAQLKYEDYKVKAGRKIYISDSQIVKTLSPGISINNYYKTIVSVFYNQLFLILFGFLVILLLIIFIIWRRSNSEKVEIGELKKLKKKSVYSINGNKLGKIKEIFLINKKKYGVLVRLDRKLSKISKKKSIVIKKKYFISIGDVVIVNKKVYDLFEKKYKK